MLIADDAINIEKNFQFLFFKILNIFGITMDKYIKMNTNNHRIGLVTLEIIYCILILNVNPFFNKLLM